MNGIYINICELKKHPIENSLKKKCSLRRRLGSETNQQTNNNNNKNNNNFISSIK